MIQAYPVHKAMAGLACEQHGRHSPEERHCRLSIRER